MFEEEEIKKNDQLIVENDDSKWSSAFSIEDVGDFQVEFESQIPEQEQISRMTLLTQKKGTLASVAGKNYKAWHMPNDSNFQKRILRVVITT